MTSSLARRTVIMPLVPSIGIASKPMSSEVSTCVPLLPFAGASVPGGTTMLPLPVMFVLILPAPALANALALTSAVGRGVNAYGTVQVTALLTGHVPSAAPFTTDPVSLKALAAFGFSVVTMLAQSVAPAMSKT
jgi:hypothetical protein